MGGPASYLRKEGRQAGNKETSRTGKENKEGKRGAGWGVRVFLYAETLGDGGRRAGGRAGGRLAGLGEAGGREASCRLMQATVARGGGRDLTLRERRPSSHEPTR